MRKIKEVLRLRFGLGLHQDQIARSCSIGQATVHRYLEKAAAAKLSWPLPDDLDDQRLDELLFPSRPLRTPAQPRPGLDFGSLQAQLQTHKHLTLQLLWEEYRETHPDGYGYSRYVAGKNMLRGSLVARVGQRAALATRNISWNVTLRTYAWRFTLHQTPRSSLAADRQRDTAAFADERNRYLRHCSDHGASPTTLKLKHNELLWISRHLDSRASHGVGMEALLPIAQKREKLSGATTAAQRVVDIGRPWLRFLGWWREPTFTFQYQCELDRYVTWMRDERGFTPSTVEQWGRIARRFLRWCEQANRELAALQIGDIDEYFATQGTGRWSRVCVASTASALRGFLRHAAMQGICASGLAAAICRPRLYRQESLPYAPDWSDVRRMLADAATDKPRDIRDRAILLLLAVYGMRSGEVAALRLDQIDWAGRMIRIFRLKRRQPQIYPLLPSVAEALAVYIDTVRPSSSCAEVFLCMQAPRRPLKAGSIYDVANRRFVALEIKAVHRGGHALRHACAARLLAEGLTLKEIGDHLGHRSTSATCTYAKVNMVSLREVGSFDLGDLQ